VLSVESESGPTEMEFTNINREELSALNTYINGPLTSAMREDAERGDEDEKVAVKQDTAPAASAPAAPAVPAPERTSGRPRRRAAVLADETTRAQVNTGDDEDEDDEENDVAFEEGEAGEEGGEESGDDSDSDSDSSDEDFDEDADEADLMDEINATIREAGEDANPAPAKKAKAEEEEDGWGVE
jgi:hypothetical protein